ncbi:energy transducer TonB [Vibrio sp.]|uniref:energy transducer TonB n=1 Tax=Vibrio sp. TaxID=678 RepID=UPI003AA914D1
MNVRRYTCAAIISFGAHAALVSQFDEQKAFAMPVGTQASTISLQFVKVPSPSTSNKSEIKPTESTNLKSSSEKTEPIPPPSKAVQPVVNKKPVKKKNAIEKQTVAKKEIEKNLVSKRSVVKDPSIDKPQPKAQVEPVIEKELSAQASPASSAKQGVSEKPILIEQPSFLAPPTKPRYPRLAQRRGIEGTAMYEIWLDENGQQIKQNLLSSSGASMLDQAALEAIKKWKFSPRKINGTSIAHRVQVPIRFKLD